MPLPHYGGNITYCTECFLIQSYIDQSHNITCKCENRNVIRVQGTWEIRQELDRKRKHYLRDKKLERILHEKSD